MRTESLDDVENDVGYYNDIDFQMTVDSYQLDVDDLVVATEGLIVQQIQTQCALHIQDAQDGQELQQYQDLFEYDDVAVYDCDAIVVQ